MGVELRSVGVDEVVLGEGALGDVCETVGVALTWRAVLDEDGVDVVGEEFGKGGGQLTRRGSCDGRGWG